MGFINGYPYTDFHELNLDWIVKHFKQFVDELASLKEWRSTHEKEYQELKKFMDELKDGILPPALYKTLHDWFINNAFDLVGEMVKHVYFGLTDDGYFTAYIPQQWKELIFNTTGYDIVLPFETEYGHLTLSY